MTNVKIDGIGVATRGSRKAHTMRRALTTAGLVAVLLTAAPNAAQTIVSTHPPLSPAEAVRVLRASQSPVDVTDVPFYGLDRSGPLVLVGSRGGASASAGPWDWPPEASEPIRPLAEPWSMSAYLGRQGFRGSRSAAPVVTLSPWSMSAYVGGSPHGSPRRSRGVAPVPQQPTQRDGTADAATPHPQRTFSEGRPGAGVIIRR